MLLWFVSLSAAGVFVVFRDPAIDYRLIALGALVPDVVDGIVRRGVGPLHSVVVAVALLAAVMGATVGRRALRRRLLAVPIGVFAHLVLDGAWTSTAVFWWPLGGHVGSRPLPSFDRGVGVVVLQELVGLAVLILAVQRFRLVEPRNRDRFLRTGRLDRTLR